MIGFNPNDVISLKIEKDLETAERCGASGTFQVINATLMMANGDEIDVTSKIDQGYHYFSEKDVANDLGINPDKIDYED